MFDEKVEHRVHEGDGIVVPAGTCHNVTHTPATKMLKLYTIYSPPNHPDWTVHNTKVEADEAEVAEARTPARV